MTLSKKLKSPFNIPNFVMHSHLSAFLLFFFPEVDRLITSYTDDVSTFPHCVFGLERQGN
jgi:hypothetical protein